MYSMNFCFTAKYLIKKATVQSGGKKDTETFIGIYHYNSETVFYTTITIGKKEENSMETKTDQWIAAKEWGCIKMVIVLINC